MAIDFALKYPEYVKALVLAAPAINGKRYPLRLMIEAIKTISSLKSKGFEAAVEAFIKNPFWSYFIPDESNPKARELVLENIRTRRNFYSWDFKLAEPLKPYAGRRLREIQVPTLIIVADKDKAFNIKVGNNLKRCIDNSKQVFMSNAGHLPFVENPQEFNEKVQAFLKEVQVV